MIKHTHSGTVRCHRHPLLVDIEKYSVVVFWIALQDVDATNGALTVIPNTFYDLNMLKSGSLPSHEFDQQAQIIPVKKGDILAFNNLLKANIIYTINKWYDYTQEML